MIPSGRRQTCAVRGFGLTIGWDACGCARPLYALLCIAFPGVQPIAAQQSGKPAESESTDSPESLTAMEARLASLEGQGRLDLLLEIVGHHFERLPGPTFAHGQEAERLLEQFPGWLDPAAGVVKAMLEL